jgi:DNA end-binding protein Ku
MAVHHFSRMKQPEKKAARSQSSRNAAPAAGRGVWSGQLRLALVSIPVQLVSAVQSGARLSFHQIDEKSKKRIRYEKVAPGIGKVEASNIAKGFEISKGEYVFVTDEDIDKVKIEARKTIDLVQFVDHCEIDPIYFEKPYYVVPDGSLAEEAYTVLRDAMRATGKMGVGQFVMRGREYVAALKPCGRGMMLETLRFADEVRAAAPFFADVEEGRANQELLDMAKDLIKRKTRKFDAGAFHDHYTAALRALIEAKAKHGTIVQQDEEVRGPRNNVIDLVAALRASVKENESGAKPAPKKTAAPRAVPAAKRRKAG